MKMEEMVIVSVDDHIVEPSDMFWNHLRTRELEAAPRIVEKNGNEIWVRDDLVRTNIGLNAVGRPKNEWAWSLSGSTTCARPPTTSMPESTT